MGTGIEWTDETWNVITGCTKVSPGCTNCYAERMSKRLAGRFGYPADDPFRVTLHPDRLNQPLHWKKPRRVFVCSMGDLFHEDVPNWFVLKVFQIMAMDTTHTYQVLTKRVRRMRMFFTNNLNVNRELCGEGWRVGWPLPHVHLGVSVENQECADERIPLLLQTPAAVRFVSVEPMLGPVSLESYLTIDGCHTMSDGSKYAGICLSPSCGAGLNWVIIGYESGPGRRPMELKWAIGLVNQCKETGVPVFVKQIEVNGKVSHSPAEWPEELRVREYPA